ncbi:endonuclease III [Lactobacillus sp. PV037]|uniref:endonuclease III n=1 Tax=Lactobacillus sp. PV037 TaxID=2594496 RepID=UPI00223F1212|nr:endonuclease III [Lactobacillus sp. PV037]QNQ83587.1 endonuclease III [Lactobacillus sp. PV037]
MEKLLSDEEALVVLQKIMNIFPDAKGELKWDSVFHLLCAVMMSAQTTDKMVNKVTPNFNQKFPDSKSLKNASLSEIESTIKVIGLYRTKAKHLKETATILTDRFNGVVPREKQTLITLPGVGEKTANVVLAEAFQIPAIAVDTHVSRISKLFKIVPAKATPHQIEKRLEEILPQEQWIHAHHALIAFGRYKLPARKKGIDPYSLLS